MGRKKQSEGSTSRKRNNEESPPLSKGLKKSRIVHEKKEDYEHELSNKADHCWTCRSNVLTDDIWYFWSCCPRIYHYDCLAVPPTSETEKCPECQLESVDGTRLSKPVPRIKLKHLLLSVVQKYLDDGKERRKSKDKKEKNKFKLLPVFLKWPPNAEDDLFKVVDFNYLINKIQQNSYSKISEFFGDVKWILHNCHLLYGSQSAVTKDAEKLIKLIKADLFYIEACHECCYPGSTDADFIKSCNPPHPIVWAKMGKSPHWPAKCLKVNQDTAFVKFFGIHQSAKLPIKNLYYMSRHHPSLEPKTKSYKDSIFDLEEYIESFQLQRKELFIYYKDKILFKPENAGKENQVIDINSMNETPSHQDDLQLGAEFSNLNHPPMTTSFISDDQMPSTQPQAEVASNSDGEPIPVVSSRRPLENEMNAISRFFLRGNARLDSEQINKIFDISRLFMKQISFLLRRQEKDYPNQILKQRAQFDAEKKEMKEESSKLQSKIMILQDQLQNSKMILKSFRDKSNVIVKRYENESQKILQDKEKLIRDQEEEIKRLKDELEKIDIINAKRNAFCYVCINPANIECCLRASYCSPTCQENHKEDHEKICIKKHIRVHQEEYREVTVEQSVKEYQAKESVDQCKMYCEASEERLILSSSVSNSSELI